MIININKPVDWSSFDVVKKIRNITKHKKVGHGGTLDPFATGVLMIGTEKDTKSLSHIAMADKTYEAELCLGKTTNTLDTEGQIISQKSVPDISLNFIIDTLESFIGHQTQSPPMFSAKKHKGTRLYKLARQGIVVKREDINIVINKIDLINFDGQNIKFRVECSKGTYIRVLGKDIAEKLGTIGYLTALTRTNIGEYSINESLSIESFIESWKSTNH